MKTVKLLVCAIAVMFVSSIYAQSINNEQFNKNNTQLVFVSHDAAQIQEFLFAKDQINIVDKDYFGKTEITRFADFTGIRKDIPFEKWYLSGRLGGVPMIDTDYIQFEIEKKDGQKES